MSLFIFRPAVVGTYNAYALTAGTDKVSAVDPLWPIAHDDAASYITGAAGVSQSYTCTVPPIVVSRINNIAIYHRCRDDAAAGQTRTLFRLGGVDVYGAWTSILPAVTWVTSAGEVLARPGGGDWAWDDLATLEIGMQTTGDVGNIIKVTSLWAMLDVSLPVAGCAPLVI
jgi:hypothetical protein